jgi:hypothetical protein
MILTLIVGVVAFVAGAVTAYFFLRNNPKKAAVVNSAVKTVGDAAQTVSSTVSKL